jgi:hypothetical protein
VVTRRGLLAAGALAALAGCGEEDRQEAAVARPADVLLASLAAERAFGAAAGSSPRIAARSRERAGALAAAVSAEGGRPHDAPAPAGGGGDPIALGRAALEAHIAALPSLEGRELRRLGAAVVVGAATDLAVLGAEPEPFPGSGT